MSKQYQYSLLPSIKPEFGGSLNSGKRKVKRPLVTKRPMHVIFKSSMAKGSLSFLRTENQRKVRSILKQEVQRRHVRVFRLSVNSNHFHFLMQGRSRREIQAFFRVVAGRVAQAITGAARGKAWGCRFWDQMVFTRVVEWGRAFRIALDYVAQNDAEARGLVPYAPRIKRKANPADLWGPPL